MKTKGYRRSQRCRKKIEELFGKAKELMCLRRMKFRRLKFAPEQVLLTAAAQNIKKLVKHLEKNASKPGEAIEKAANSLVSAFFEAFWGKYTSDFRNTVTFSNLVNPCRFPTLFFQQPRNQEQVYACHPKFSINDFKTGTSATNIKTYLKFATCRHIYN
jgi:hypothetical protein